MATLKQRLHKKNSSGSYDVVHLETSAGLVLMSDGTTVEAAVNGKAASSHTHSGYASSSHTHTGVYANYSHTHTASQITGLSTGVTVTTGSLGNGTSNITLSSSAKVLILYSLDGFSNPVYVFVKYNSTWQTYDFSRANIDITFSVTSSTSIKVYNNESDTIYYAAF